MSPLSQARLLLPLLEVLRNHLSVGEYASFQRTPYGFTYLEARTARGSMTASVTEDGLYTLAAAGNCYTCDPNTTKAAICNAVRRALNDAREEWV